MKPKARRRRTTWPVVFCAFVSGITGGASVMMSPLAETPEGQLVVDVAKNGMTTVTDLVKHVTEELR